MGLFDKIKNQAINEKNSIAQGAVQRSYSNKSVDVVFDDLPETFEQFCALPQAAMSSPFDTAALTVAALCVYPFDKDTSIKMLNFLKGPKPLSQYDLQFIADRFCEKDYVPRSYFEGATPQNDYMPTGPYKITVSENPYSYTESNYAKLYVKSGGADSPRSIALRLAKDGKWYLWEQYLLSDIRQPESTNPWA